MLTREEHRKLLALLRATRRFVAAEKTHASRSNRELRLGLHAGALTSRDAVDLAHADLMGVITAREIGEIIAALSRK